MLAKTNRLKKKDFKQIFQKANQIKQDFFILKFIKNNISEKRFGIIVSSKVAKKANVRNKIKRRIRTILRAELPNIKKGIDIILIALSGIETKNFQEIKQMLNKAFQKIRIYL